MTGRHSSLTPRAYHRDSQLEHICWVLKAEAECNYLSGPLYGESLAFAMCVHLLRESFETQSAMAKKGGMAPRTLHQVIDYIKVQFGQAVAHGFPGGDIGAESISVRVQLQVCDGNAAAPVRDTHTTSACQGDVAPDKLVNLGDRLRGGLPKRQPV